MITAKIRSDDLKLLKSGIRMTVLYFIFVAVVMLSNFILSICFIIDLSMSGIFYDRAQEVTSTLPLLLVFFYFSRIFVQYNTKARNEFLAKNKHWSFSKDIKSLFTSSLFWFEILCLTLLVVVLPVSFVFGEVLFRLFGEQLFPLLPLKITLMAILLPMFVILHSLAHLSVHRFWNKNRKEFANLDVKWYEDIRCIITRVISQTIIFSILFYVFPSLVAMLIVIWQAISYFALPVIKIVVPVIVVYYAFIYLRALKKRRKFIEELKKVCEVQGLSLSDIRNPRKSVFRLESGFDFSVIADGITYDCKLLSGLRPGSSMVFTPCGGLHVVPFKFFRHEWFRFFFKFDYRFESDNKKVIIVSPMPRALYEKDYHPNAEMDPGGTVNGYRIQNATGFISALRRKTMDIKSW